jgi:DNA-binding NtrC family response regulator
LWNNNKIAKNLSIQRVYILIRSGFIWYIDSIGVYEVSNNKRIVSVVDDDIYITKLFHEALRQNIDKVTIFAFTDPVIAFEHFTENKENFALVISDLRMPGLNGLELLKKVKDSNSQVRTILMSAYNFEEDESYLKYMKDEVINSTIEKPVTMNRLYQRVREQLNAYQTEVSGNS